MNLILFADLLIAGEYPQISRFIQSRLWKHLSKHHEIKKQRAAAERITEWWQKETYRIQHSPWPWCCWDSNVCRLQLCYTKETTEWNSCKCPPLRFIYQSSYSLQRIAMQTRAKQTQSYHRCWSTQALLPAGALQTLPSCFHKQMLLM